jgi:hypothetical protein
MSKSFGILTGKLASIALKVFATDLNRASCIKWGKRVRLHTKIWVHRWTKVGLMKFAPKIGIGMNSKRALSLMINETNGDQYGIARSLNQLTTRYYSRYYLCFCHTYLLKRVSVYAILAIGNIFDDLRKMDILEIRRLFPISGI